MRSFSIVFIKPGINNPLCFLDRIEKPSIKTTISEYSVKTFIMTILPGRSGNRKGVRSKTGVLNGEKPIKKTKHSLRANSIICSETLKT